MPGVVHVAAAALIDPDDRVLLARRHPDSHQGGLWEFPGGKLKSGETVTDGLYRELHEELGIELSGHRPLIQVTHQYSDLRVLLDVHLVEAWHGEPIGREGQPLVWVARSALGDYPMPAADKPIVSALKLPAVYLITPPQVDRPITFLDALEASLQQGARLVQLRLFDITQSTLRELGRAACELCHGHQARVLLNGDPETAATIGADGVHLSSRALWAAKTRPVAAGHLLAASCHSPEDLDEAERLDADFALLSPVLPTRSHPDADPLGWDRFASWVSRANLPVYALGGMYPDLLATAWQHGGQGIAGIRGLWHGDLAA